MDFILHGAIATCPIKSFVVHHCPCATCHQLVTPAPPAAPCPLDSVVLQKPAVSTCTTPTLVTLPTHYCHYFHILPTRMVNSFYLGFCYLAAVDTADCIKACAMLGNYLSIATLACSDIIHCNSAYLTVQYPSLYHLTTQPTSIPLLLGNRSWVIGTELPPNLFHHPTGPPSSSHNNPYSGPPHSYGPRAPNGSCGGPRGGHLPQGNDGRYYNVNREPLGFMQGPPFPLKKKSNPVHNIFQPYSLDPARHHTGLLSTATQAWKSATRDYLNIMIDSLKASLMNLP